MNGITTLNHKGLISNTGDINLRNYQIITEIPSDFPWIMFKGSPGC
jgi:hypothetical protein